MATIFGLGFSFWWSFFRFFFVLFLCFCVLPFVLSIYSIKNSRGWSPPVSSKQKLANAIRTLIFLRDVCSAVFLFY
jgi:uncharacterized membrane protein